MCWSQVRVVARLRLRMLVYICTNIAAQAPLRTTIPDTLLVIQVGSSACLDDDCEVLSPAFRGTLCRCQH